MINISILLIAHFIADFLLQDEKTATNKSKSIRILATHITEYSCIMWISSIFIFNGDFNKGLIFMLITFIAHFITDYITSKLSSKAYKAKRYYGCNGFFTIIGFDQLLHGLQLILTYYLLL